MPYQLAVQPGPGFYRQPAPPPPPQQPTVNPFGAPTAAALDQGNVALAQQAAGARGDGNAYFQNQLAREDMMRREQAAQQAPIQEAIIKDWHEGRAFDRQNAQAFQQADLQSQLNNVKLGQEDNYRLQRLQQSRDAVRANPNLSDAEKEDLYTQITSNLNPLENRQRQGQMLFQQIQSQALQQQTQQQAQLFNQHQQWLSQGIAGQLQTVTDPLTGRQQLFHVDAQGKIQALDFSQSQQRHEMDQIQSAAGVANSLQGFNQREQLFPGQMQLQGHAVGLAQLSNERLGLEVSQARNMNPLYVRNLQAEIDRREAENDHNTEMLPLERERVRASLRQMRAHTAGIIEQTYGAQQTNDFNRQMNPLRLNQAREEAAFQNRPLSERVRTVYGAEDTQAAHEHATEQVQNLNAEPSEYNDLVAGYLRENGSPVNLFEHRPGEFRFEPSLNEGLTPNQERIARGHVSNQLANDLRQYRSGPVRHEDANGRVTLVPRERPHWLDPRLLTGNLADQWRRNSLQGMTDMTPAMVQHLMEQETERQIGPARRRQRPGQAAPIPAAGGGAPPPNPAAAARDAEAIVLRPGQGAPAPALRAGPQQPPRTRTWLDRFLEGQGGGLR